MTRTARRSARRSETRPAARLNGAALAAMALAVAAPAGALAQDGIAAAAGLSIPREELEQPVALVADSVSFDNASRVLTAEGNVEVYQGTRTLTADRIEYDQATGRISAAGNVTLRTPEGVTLISDFAEVDAGFRDALIESARMQLPGDARFAAARAQRIDGRYNVLGRAVFSPCRVCAASPTPLWRIRAKRIVHDEQEKSVHYEDAYFDVAGVTIAWLPYFSHPDPSIERASGLLTPEYLSSDVFGYALRAPVHLVLSEESDLTLTPFLMTGDNPILGLEYRRAFEHGAMELGGSVSWNDYDGDDRLRGHIDAAGVWSLDGGAAEPLWDGPFGFGWEAGFELELASDDAYLRRYEFSDTDRLTSEVFVRQGDDRGWLEFGAVRFQSLRDDEAYGEIPLAAPTFEGRRRVADDIWGGALHLRAAGYALKRTQGQDTAHLSLGADWERGWTMSNGLAFTAVGDVQADAWQVNDAAPGVNEDDSRLHPQFGVEARLPLFREDADGALARLTGGRATHVITPLIQAIAAPYQSGDSALPNEDSQALEFDRTNLFSLRRHAGWDGVEEGPRVNIGLRYALLGADGTDFSAGIGQVLRFEAIDSFGAGDGLNGTASDYVGGWSLRAPEIGSIAHRFQVSSGGELTRNEVYADVAWGRTSLTGSYLMLAPEDSASPDRHEVAGTLWREITPNWAVGTELRRDLEEKSWVRTQGMVRYSNECVNLEFRAGRRFTSSEDVPASTYFGVRLRLVALGDETSGRGAATGACAPQIEPETPLDRE